MNKLTAPQAALLAKLPATFQVFEEFSRSDTPGTAIRTEEGRPLFTLTTGEPRAFKSLMRARLISRVRSISIPDGNFTDGLAVWTKA
jgi:hypothetical protein